MTTHTDTIHMRLKNSGSPEKFKLFCFLAGTLDIDFPLAPKGVGRDSGEDRVCTTCGGLIYKNPAMTPDNIRALARQVNELKTIGGNLKVKIKSWSKNPDCAGPIVQVEEHGPIEDGTIIEGTATHSPYEMALVQYFGSYPFVDTDD